MKLYAVSNDETGLANFVATKREAQQLARHRSFANTTNAETYAGEVHVTPTKKGILNLLNRLAVEIVADDQHGRYHRGRPTVQTRDRKQEAT